MTDTKRYFGKYRGLVMNNIDPQQIGRLQVQIPDFAGLLPSSWAMPCVPFASKQGGVFVVPQVGAGVWVGPHVAVGARSRDRSQWCRRHPVTEEP